MVLTAYAFKAIIRDVLASRPSFDPRRQAILLVAGDKQGVNERRFYERLIVTAEKRLDEHLESLARNGNKNRS